MCRGDGYVKMMYMLRRHVRSNGGCRDDVRVKMMYILKYRMCSNGGYAEMMYVLTDVHAKMSYVSR